MQVAHLMCQRGLGKLQQPMKEQHAESWLEKKIPSLTDDRLLADLTSPTGDLPPTPPAKTLLAAAGARSGCPQQAGGSKGLHHLNLWPGHQDELKQEDCEEAAHATNFT